VQHAAADVKDPQQCYACARTHREEEP